MNKKKEVKSIKKKLYLNFHISNQKNKIDLIDWLVFNTNISSISAEQILQINLWI